MKKIYLVAIAVAALTVSSCSQDEVLNMNPEAGPQAISFNGAYLGNAAETRGSVTDKTALTTGKHKDQGIGVFAYYSGTKKSTDSGWTWDDNFMKNLQVKYDATNSTWTYDNPLRYWPSASEYVSFVAYAPHGTQSNSEAISHTVATTIENQTDLVVSDVVKDQTSTTSDGKVTFTMKHVLSRIGLKMTQENLPTDYSITLTKVTLGETNKGLYTSGTYNAVSNPPSWTTAGATTQTLSWNASDMSNNGVVTNVEANKSTSNADGKYLFVIPQNFTGTDAALPISVTYKLKVKEGAEMSYTFDGKIAQEFEKGKAYQISLIMNYENLPGDDEEKPVAITFEVNEVAGWVTSGNSETSVTITQ